MTKIELNPILRSISGKMGDVVFRTSKTGKVSVAKSPKKSRRKPSAAQLAQRERFKLANTYAATAKEQPVYVELAARTDRPVQRVAASDFLTPPAIHGIERRGDHIDIYATDDVLVTKIHVTIRNEDGVTLEQGSANLVHEGWWKYETEVPGNVQVEAFDLAGNVTRLEA